jgi:hypothetical protein
LFGSQQKLLAHAMREKVWIRCHKSGTLRREREKEREREREKKEREAKKVVLNGRFPIDSEFTFAQQQQR